MISLLIWWSSRHKFGRNRYNFNNDSILSDYYFSRERPFRARRRSSQRIFFATIYDWRTDWRPDRRSVRSAHFVGSISRSSIVRGVVPSIRSTLIYRFFFLYVCFFDCELLAKRFLRILHENLIDISFRLCRFFGKLFAVRKFFSRFYSYLFHIRNLVRSARKSF